jgi:hypothetical protein
LVLLVGSGIVRGEFQSGCYSSNWGVISQGDAGDGDRIDDAFGLANLVVVCLILDDISVSYTGSSRIIEGYLAVWNYNRVQPVEPSKACMVLKKDGYE